MVVSGPSPFFDQAPAVATMRWLGSALCGRHVGPTRNSLHTFGCAHEHGARSGRRRCARAGQTRRRALACAQAQPGARGFPRRSCWRTSALCCATLWSRSGGGASAGCCRSRCSRSGSPARSTRTTRSCPEKHRARAGGRAVSEALMLFVICFKLSRSTMCCTAIRNIAHNTTVILSVLNLQMHKLSAIPAACPLQMATREQLVITISTGVPGSAGPVRRSAGQCMPAAGSAAQHTAPWAACTSHLQTQPTSKEYNSAACAPRRSSTPRRPAL